MQKLVWKNSIGDEINLTSGNYGITEWEGFANTSLNIQSQQVPFQDGGVFLDALMEQRELSVTLAMNDGGNLETRYRLRRELIHALNPKLGEGYLIYTNDFISKRIKCVAQIPLFETHNSNDSGTPKASLAWTACEPYWEDLEESFVNIPLGNTVIVNNQGDIPTQIKARFFTQNVVNPLIKNMTTNKKIEYHNTLEKTLNINTNIGNKTIYTENINLKSIGCYGNFTNVCFCKKNSLWVATTSNGAIFYSYNGTEWNICEFETEIVANFKGIVYADNLNLFVAVGAWVSDVNCKIATSSDGIHWINRGSSYNALNSIAYSENLNLFVAVGEYSSSYSAIITSSDGINWNTSISSGITNILKKVIFVDILSCFYIVSDSGVTAKSSDGINWEHYSQGGNDITYSQKQGIFVMPYFTTIDDKIYPTIKTSTDFETWTSIVLDNLEDVRIMGVSYSEGLDIFVATGNYNTIITSQNGTVWNIVQKNDDADIFLYTSLYSKEQKKYLVMGTDSLIYSSNNGINWIATQNMRGTLNGVTYSKKLDLYIGVGNNGLILASRDGTIWTDKNSNITSNLKAVTYSEELEIFIAVGEYNKILKSDNGNVWEEVFSTTFSSYKLNDVIYSEKLHIFVACGFAGTSGDIMTSSDGINWDYIRNVISIPHCFCVTYSEEKNLFIIGTTSKGIITSSDGINWNKKIITILPSNTEVINITYSKELEFFFILRGNYIYKSGDGINWTSEQLAVNLSNVYNVVYSELNKMYYALCSNGKVYTSIYLVNWDKIRDSGTKLNSASISYKDNNIVFVGDDGIIMISYYSAEENQIENISADSDMSFNLKNGENVIFVSCIDGDFNCSLTYRQKYIGV